MVNKKARTKAAQHPHPAGKAKANDSNGFAIQFLGKEVCCLADGINGARINPIIRQLTHLGSKHSHATLRECMSETHQARLLHSEMMNSMDQNDPWRLGDTLRHVETGSYTARRSVQTQNCFMRL